MLTGNQVGQVLTDVIITLQYRSANEDKNNGEQANQTNNLDSRSYKMKKSFLVTLVTITMSGTAYMAVAADDFAFQRQIEGRQAFMQVYKFNLGILGAMARGNMEYDADVASASANNLLAASKMNNAAMWPAGSHTEAAGLGEFTAAKESAWTTYPEIADKGKALTEALTAMAAVAGDGADALRANMSDVGNGCKGCHDDFRLSRD